MAKGECWIVEVVNKHHKRRWVKTQGGAVVDPGLNPDVKCYRTRATAKAAATRLQNSGIFTSLYGHGAETRVRKTRSG